MMPVRTLCKLSSGEREEPQRKQQHIGPWWTRADITSL